MPPLEKLRLCESLSRKSSITTNRGYFLLWKCFYKRKNWLFSASVKGVKASANLYSLIETAKANNLEPYAYLRHVFIELPPADTVDAIEALLPSHLVKDQIRSG